VVSSILTECELVWLSARYALCVEMITFTLDLFSCARLDVLHRIHPTFPYSSTHRYQRLVSVASVQRLCRDFVSTTTTTTTTVMMMMMTVCLIARSAFVLHSVVHQQRTLNINTHGIRIINTLLEK